MRILNVSATTALGVAVMLGVPVVAQGPDRLTDKDVKALIDTVYEARDRFEDQLDGKVKDAVLRGPSGEVNVSRFLDDFQENVDRLKNRFKPDYAASAEAAAVLRQGSAISAFMKTQPPGLKGTSEWDRLAGSLTRLAGVYNASFPLTNESVRRVSDGEAAAAAEEVEKQVDQFKNAVNRERTLAGPAKDALKDAADVLKDSAKALRSRLNDSKPSTAEARQLFDALRRLEESSKSQKLPSSSLTSLGAMKAPLTTLRNAFGMASEPGT
jgi:hypothetical protein